MSPGARHSRFNWKNEVSFTTPEGLGVLARAFTNPEKYQFGYNAGDVKQALINVSVSLLENQNVFKELELPPVWAILEQNPVFFFQDLDKLGKDLEEIVPLVRAYLP